MCKKSRRRREKKYQKIRSQEIYFKKTLVTKEHPVSQQCQSAAGVYLRTCGARTPRGTLRARDAPPRHLRGHSSRAGPSPASGRQPSPPPLGGGAYRPL